MRWDAMDGLGHLHHADPKQWGAVFMNHPQTWRLLIDAPKSVQGFWHFVSLQPDAYTQIKQGAIVTTDIQTDMIRGVTPGCHDIFFATCCIRPSYRSISVAIDLVNSFWTTLIELAEQGVLVREICANALTRHGNLLVRTAGLKYVCDHQVAGQIFAASMQDIVKQPRMAQSVSQSMRRLREFY